MDLFGKKKIKDLTKQNAFLKDRIDKIEDDCHKLHEKNCELLEVMENISEYFQSRQELLEQLEEFEGTCLYNENGSINTTILEKLNFYLKTFLETGIKSNIKVPGQKVYIFTNLNDTVLTLHFSKDKSCEDDVLFRVAFFNDINSNKALFSTTVDGICKCIEDESTITSFNNMLDKIIEIYGSVKYADSLNIKENKPKKQKRKNTKKKK